MLTSSIEIMDIHRNLWISIEINRNPSISIESNGIPLISIEIYGYLGSWELKSMEIHEIQRNLLISMEIHGLLGQKVCRPVAACGGLWRPVAAELDPLLETFEAGGPESLAGCGSLKDGAGCP